METSQDGASVEIFRALADPVRWNILQQIAAVDELACAALEETLPVSKPTISYHTKILQQAGLLSARKEGRNYFYALRREALQEVLDDLRRLAPTPRPVAEKTYGPVKQAGRHRAERAQTSGHRHDRHTRIASGDDEVVVLAW